MRYVAVLLILFLLAAPGAEASTKKELEGELKGLYAQIEALSATLKALEAVQRPDFERDLAIGSTGEDVERLQWMLLDLDISIPAGATGYFGTQTRTAVAAFQAQNRIAPAVGYFGPATRARMNAVN